MRGLGVLVGKTRFVPHIMTDDLDWNYHGSDRLNEKNKLDPLQAMICRLIGCSGFSYEEDA